MDDIEDYIFIILGILVFACFLKAIFYYRANRRRKMMQAMNQQHVIIATTATQQTGIPVNVTYQQQANHVPSAPVDPNYEVLNPGAFYKSPEYYQPPPSYDTAIRSNHQ